MADLHPRQQLLAAQFQEPGTQIRGEVLVVGGQQHGLGVAGRQLGHEVADAVQGDDRLAGAGATADPGGAGVAALDQLGLGGVEEDLPATEVPCFQCLAQGVVGRGDDRGGPLGGCPEVLGVDGVRGGDRCGDLVPYLVEGPSVVQRQQDLTGELRRVLDQSEELLLGGEGADDRHQGLRHSQLAQLRVAPGGKQRLS